MSSALIALVVAFALGTVVVVIGMRRNLSEATRNGLPRFGGDAEGANPTLGLYEGEERRRRPFTPGQLRLVVGIYLLLALIQAASAIFSSDDRLFHAAAACFLVLGVVVLWVTNGDPAKAGFSRSGSRNLGAPPK